MTDIYMSYDNLKRTGQLRNVRVESGFGTVWAAVVMVVTNMRCDSAFAFLPGAATQYLCKWMTDQKPSL